jgi:hypothetical protein
MRILVILILVAFAIIFNGCEKNEKISDSNEAVKRQIQAKVNSSSRYLANLEAIYGLAFTHFESSLIYSDEIYVREDEAKALYGFSLDKANIEITGNKVLNVILPLPKKVAVDKKTLFVSNVHDKYVPKDKNKNNIDIDLVLNEKLVEALNRHESATIEITKKMTKQYFETLASRYGLDLQIKYDN